MAADFPLAVNVNPQDLLYVESARVWPIDQTTANTAPSSVSAAFDLHVRVMSMFLPRETAPRIGWAGYTRRDIPDPSFECKRILTLALLAGENGRRCHHRPARRSIV